MTKGKDKTHSSDGSATPLPQGLRSRKREGHDISQTDSVQDALHHKDTEENNVVTTLQQLPQSPLQEQAIMANEQAQAAGQSCLTKQDDSRESTHLEEMNGYLKNVTNETSEGQEESSVSSSSKDPNDTNKSEMEEITPQEGIRSSSQTCTNQLQVDFLPTSEESDGTCATALEKQLGAKENCPCNLERNHEKSQEEPCNMCVADVKEITREAAVGLPAKKKRRMGMCGLTTKERNHFLQTRKCENGQNGAERAEITSTLPLLSSPLSFLVEGITEQSEGEIKLQSNHCGGDDRTKPEVHIAVTTSDGTSAVSDPGYSGEKNCEAEGGTEPDPDQTGEAKPEPPVQDEVKKHLEDLEGQKLEGSADEIMIETPEQQRKECENGLAEVVCGLASSLHTDPAGNEEAEEKDGSETDSLQVNGVTKTGVESKEEMIVNANDEAEAEVTSSSITQPGGSNSEAAVTPTGSQRKDSSDPSDEPGPFTDTEDTQTRDSTGPFGSGSLDVSDSQLNTIVLMEKDVMEGGKDSGSSDHDEDATVLIHGLIRELSSLNRTVMATHRELENLRRGSKISRSCSH